MLSKPSLSMKLDSIRCGFAAGCEAGLCPAVDLTISVGLCPWSGLCPPSGKGQARTRGIAPKLFENADGGAEPRLTSGGEAAADGSSFMITAQLETLRNERWPERWPIFRVLLNPVRRSRIPRCLCVSMCLRHGRQQ